MKKQLSKSVFAALAAGVVLAVIGFVFPAGENADPTSEAAGLFAADSVLLRLLSAVALVVLVSNLVLILLSFFKNRSGRIGTLVTVISSLVKYASVLLAGCWGLQIIGVNVSTIFAGVGVFALIIGFGAESLVADLVTGVFILFENQYNVGDIIEIDGFRGKVKEVGIRTLSLEDSGGNIKIINNSELRNIVNRSNQRSVAVCDVTVDYQTDLEQLEQTLTDILQQIKQAHSDVFCGRVEYLGVETLGDWGMVLRIVADVNEEHIFTGRRLLNKELKIGFDKAGILIPYPRVDVRSR